MALVRPGGSEMSLHEKELPDPIQLLTLPPQPTTDTH